eukprot:COSAG05_NODE_2960_length_2462_cov_3.174778_2_plen_142_part_00
MALGGPRARPASHSLSREDARVGGKVYHHLSYMYCEWWWRWWHRSTSSQLGTRSLPALLGSSSSLAPCEWVSPAPSKRSERTYVSTRSGCRSGHRPYRPCRGTTKCPRRCRPPRADLPTLSRACRVAYEASSGLAYSCTYT